MKKIIFLVFIIISFIIYLPITAYAGIICNDGWESSCVVEAPGCCSHHGGTAGGNDYNNYSSNYNDDSFINNLENGEYAGILTILILGIPIILGIVFNNKEKKTALQEKTKKEEEQEEIKEYYKKYLKKLWDKYLIEKSKSSETIYFDKNDRTKTKIKKLEEHKTHYFNKLEDAVKQYKLKISYIKNNSDENLNSIGKAFKQEAINSYQSILDNIYHLCVINDILAELDKSNNYLSYIKYRNTLLKDYSVFDELLSIYRK